jgi:pimeloyl-ACP methyl ester carboxylesterase
VTLLRALRALARVEWRQHRRHPKRSLLLILLVAVPVAAVVGGATLARVTEPTDDEARSRSLGRADLRVDGIDTPEDAARVIALLPAEAVVTRVFLGHEIVRVPGRQLRGVVVAAPRGALALGGTADGLLRMTSGRAPENAGEVALSPVLLAALPAAPGDTVTLEYGGRRVVSGVVVDPEDLNAAVVVRTPAAVEHGGTHVALVTAPPAGAAPAWPALAARLREAGFAARARADVSAEGGGLAALVFALGLIGFFEAALVIAAAFAVSLTRRQHDIGLLGATGASGGVVALAIVGSAAALALVGSLLGAGVGIAAAAALHPLLDGWNHRWNGPFEVAPEHLAAGLLLGVATAAAAAAIPAAVAVRLPIRAALSGRRPGGAPARGWLVAGGGLLAVGVGLLVAAPRLSGAIAGTAALLGPIFGILGFGMASPWLLGVLARGAGRLPIAWKLAVRDAGRFRGRNGPVVTAVLAGMSMSVTVAVLSASLDRTIAAFPARYRADQLLVSGPGAEAAARRLAAELDARAVAPLAAAYDGAEPVRARFVETEPRPFLREWVAVGDDTLLLALGLESARDDFQAGRLVALDPPDTAPRVAFTRWRGGEPLPAPVAVAVRTGEPVGAPRFLLIRAALDTLGLSEGPPLDASLVPWLVRLPEPVAPATLARAVRLTGEFVGTTIDADRLHQRPARGAYLAVLGLCVLTGLLVLWAATALCAAESEGEIELLNAVGAPPGLLADYPAARSAWLAALGSALALPAGWLTVMSLLRAANFPLALVFPWRDALLLVFGLPLVTYLGGRLVGRATAARPGAGRPRFWTRAGLLLLGMLLSVRPAGAGAGAPVAPTPEAASPAAPAIRWEPYVGRAFDGSPLAGEIGRFRVPENRARPSGRQIELAVVRYRTTHPNPGPPIVYLAGGPGGSGVELAGPQATHPQLRLLEQRDVLGLDQRGTGLSEPNLVDVAVSLRLPLDRVVDRETVVAALREGARRVVADPGLADADLAAYNVRESAADVEDLRRALGLDRVALFGSSYGSHLGLEVLRRHGEGVERAVLGGVEGPDDTWKLPSTTQRHLDLLANDVAADPAWSARMPDLVGHVRMLLARLEAVSLDFERAGAASEGGAFRIVLGADDLRGWLAGSLSNAKARARVPAALEQFAGGDWSILADFAREERRIEVPLYALLVDCASGGSAERLERMAAERADPAYLLGDALSTPLFPELCGAVPAARFGDDARRPFECDVPVLFVSGTLDARTPPENVERLLPGFSRAAHVVVENAGHDGRELMSAEYRALLQAFLRGETVSGCRIRLPREPLAPPGDLSRRAASPAPRARG